MATISPSLGYRPKNFKIPAGEWGNWQYLLLNFTPIGEVMAEKTMTERKTKIQKNKQ